MSIPVICKNCGSKFKAPKNTEGRKVKCPKCRKLLKIIDDSINKNRQVSETSVPKVSVSNTIPVICKNCGSKFKAPDNAIGRKAKCPKCKKSLVISDDRINKNRQVSETSVPKVSVSNTIPVICKNCDGKFKVPENAIGRKVKCPKCKKSLVIYSDEDKSDAKYKSSAKEAVFKAHDKVKKKNEGADIRKKGLRSVSKVKESISPDSAAPGSGGASVFLVLWSILKKVLFFSFKILKWAFWLFQTKCPSCKSTKCAQISYDKHWENMQHKVYSNGNRGWKGTKVEIYSYKCRECNTAFKKSNRTGVEGGGSGPPSS